MVYILYACYLPWPRISLQLGVARLGPSHYSFEIANYDMLLNIAPKFCLSIMPKLHVLCRSIHDKYHHNVYAW